MAASLQQLAFQVCSHSPENTFAHRDEGNKVTLTGEAFLPASLCDPLLEAIVGNRPVNYVEMFTDRKRCQLTKLNLSNKQLKEHQEIIKALFEHNLEEVNLSNSYLDEDSANKLSENERNLQCLTLSGTKGGWTTKGASFLQNLKHLKKLDVSFIKAPFRHCVKTISGMMNLVSLDMSSTELQTILPLQNLSRTLQQLFLADACENIDNYIEELNEVIPQMESLTHLDISKRCATEDTYFRMQPYLTGNLLEKIASLPNLVYLDISGCGGLKEEDLENFRKELSRNLQFFGLFATGLEFFNNIPADKMSGAGNAQQVLISMELYEKRESYVLKALHCLFDFLSNGDITSLLRPLQLTISCAKLHITNPSIQLAASGCIFHIFQQDEAADLDAEIRRSAISFVLDILENHRNSQLYQNCLQCICCFNIPEELEFVSVRCCKILLRIMKTYPTTNLCLGAVTIFNAIVCSTAIKSKLGNMGAVQVIFGVIRDNLIRREYIENLLETAWCALWNITDENPDNCQNFIYNGGLVLFKECIKLASSVFSLLAERFEGESGLQKSMLGLMGNIAEVESLRYKFMEDDTIDLFIKLLDPGSVDFEVSYNAAGILSHVCSDGDKAWKFETLSRSDCMALVIDAISKWDVGSSRNINYRSLRPILQLLPLDFNPCGQEWAVWALANLTKVYPEKYCELLKSEGGIDLLKQLVNSDTATQSMKMYANMTIERVEKP